MKFFLGRNFGKLVLSFSSLASVFLLPSCSTFNKGEQKVFIYSNPEDATCKLYQGGVLKEEFQTPHYVILQRSSDQALSLNCAKLGYQLFAKSFESHIRDVDFSDSALTSAAADDAENQRTYSYPKEISVDLQRLKKGKAEQPLPTVFQRPEGYY
ncbi:hypothetical protein FAI40_05240 [Acetobacteraceae bacterium]|nr:hypothetical protein FAI40_05240 [Acetobacteraceae bacterium]